jgi:predicted DNA-binding protein YlxM (UPF0122 family)
MSTKKVKPTSDTIPQSDALVEMPDEREVIDPRITALSMKQQRFLHLYSTGQYSLSKLAQLLEIHPNTVSNWLKRPDIKSLLKDMQELTHESVQSRLKTLSNVAIDKLRELVNSPIDGVSLQAVKDILDRTGHKPEQKIKVDKTVITVEEKLARFIDEAIEADYEIVE